MERFTLGLNYNLCTGEMVCQVKVICILWSSNLHVPVVVVFSLLFALVAYPLVLLCLLDKRCMNMYSYLVNWDIIKYLIT